MNGKMKAKVQELDNEIRATCDRLFEYVAAQQISRADIPPALKIIVWSILTGKSKSSYYRAIR